MGTSAPATPTSTLICLEDGNDLFLDGDDDDSPSGAAVADFRLAADDHLLLLGRDDDEYVALMLSKELGDGGECGGAPLAEEVDGWTRAARALCVDWIVKTNARFRFSGKTAYVAVTYLDRFLARRRVDRDQEWALQLLSVACLSLAAKVEEHRVPRLPEFRPDQYDFDCASILRMELLVLTTLGWQMIAPTPFPYLGCFAARLRHDERRATVLRAVNCIFASIKAMSSVEYRPSTIALASILVARGDNREEGTLTFPKLAEELKAILGSSWQQLHTGHVYSCYSVMIQEDRSIGRRQQSSRELASSGVSIAAHVGSSDDATSMAAASDNNAGATISAAAAAAITDGNNKRKRLHSPQRH